MDILIGTTETNNLNFIYRNKNYLYEFSKFGSKKIITPESNKIYLINDKEKLKIVGTFKDKKEKPYKFDYSKFDYSKHDYTRTDNTQTDVLSHSENETDDETNNNPREFNKEIETIEDTISLCFGYCPNFKYNKKTNLIKFRYEKNLYNDLKNIFNYVVKRKKHIFINHSELKPFI